MSVDERNCTEYFAWDFSINRCVGLKWKYILTTQKSRVLWKRVIHCLSMKECSIGRSCHSIKKWGIQHCSTLGRTWALLTESIYNFLILSLLSLFPISRVLSNNSLTEKYLQDKSALWRVMGAQSFSFGFLVRARGSQGFHGSSRRAEQWTSLWSDASSIFSKGNISRKQTAAHVRALWKDPITVRALQEVQKQINMCLSVLALLLLRLTVMTRWCVCHIQDD